jgi:hypothetical protein
MHLEQHYGHAEVVLIVVAQLLERAHRRRFVLFSSWASVQMQLCQAHNNQERTSDREP